MFLLYIDDISKCTSSQSTVCLYADDAKLFSSNPIDLQTSLNSVASFFKSRQLKLAHEKCEHLIIGNNIDPVSLTIEGVDIQSTSTSKDLGIWINDNLKWQTHINKMSNKAYQRAHHILRSFSSSNVWTLLKAYTTYVRPILEYATTIWSPYLNKDKIKVERVQRFFTRMICQRCKIPYSSYNDRLYKLNISSLEYRRLEFDLMFLYKLLNDLLDINAKDFFYFNETHYNTRSHSKVIRSKLPFRNLNQNNFYSHRCATTWNLLPPEIVSAPTYDVFRNRLKSFNLRTIATLLF